MGPVTLRPSSPAIDRLVVDLTDRVGVFTPIGNILEAILEAQHRETLRSVGLLKEEAGVIPIESRRHLSAECYHDDEPGAA